MVDISIKRRRSEVMSLVRSGEDKAIELRLIDISGYIELRNVDGRKGLLALRRSQAVVVQAIAVRPVHCEGSGTAVRVTLECFILAVGWRCGCG